MGMELKLRQYEPGKRSATPSSRAPASTRSTAPGPAPEAIPTLAELDDPPGWLARTQRAAA